VLHRPRVRPYPYDELPRVARAQVEAGRVLLRHLPTTAGADWAEACASALGGPVEIELVEAYAAPSREVAMQARGVLATLVGAGGRRAVLALDPMLAPRLCRRALGVTEPELVAPRPLTVAEEGALELLLGILVDGSPVRVDGVLREGERLPEALLADPGVFVLSARVSTPVGAGWARLLCPQSLRLAAPPSRPERAGRREWLSEVAVPIQVQLARVQLSVAELGGLDRGDVLMLGVAGRDGLRGAKLRIRLGQGMWIGRFDGSDVVVVDGFRLQMGASSMDPERKDPERAEKKDDADDALVRELPVEVVCELGRVTMSARDLLELRPGAVIPVGRPLAGPVDLTVGGRVVARGELVDVEGELGVRVTELSG